MITFAEWLYENKLDPFEIAFTSDKDLQELKLKWKKDNNIIENESKDIVYKKLSELNIKINNDKLVKIVSKMTKKDSDQTNLVGTWLYFCLSKNEQKAKKAKEKVSDTYQKTITKYLDSFISMLEN